jgi:hypothetical protein
MVFFDFAAATAFLTLRLAALLCFALDMVGRSSSKACSGAFRKTHIGGNQRMTQILVGLR